MQTLLLACYICLQLTFIYSLTSQIHLKQDGQVNQLSEETETLAELMATINQLGGTINTAALEAIIKKTIETKNDRKDILTNNILFMPGASLVSENGEYTAAMMRSGQLIITNSNRDNVGTVGNSMSDETDTGHYMIMQGDGNLVIYSARTIRPTWHSDTYVPSFKVGSQYYLKLENNGELVMYNGKNQRIWISSGVQGGLLDILYQDESDNPFEDNEYRLSDFSS